MLVKCEIRNQGVYEKYILRLYTSLDQVIFSGKAKMKFVMLASMHCREAIAIF